MYTGEEIKEKREERANNIMKAKELFEELKSEIIKRSKDAFALGSDYREVTHADDLSSLMRALKDEFCWMCEFKIITPDLIKSYEKEFNNAGIWCNTNCKQGYLLVSDYSADASGDTVVVSMGYSIVNVYDTVKIKAHDKSTIYAYDNSSVSAYDDTEVFAEDKAIVSARDRTEIQAEDDVTVMAHDNTCVTAMDKTSVKAYDYVKVEAWGNAVITAYGTPTIEVRGSAFVDSLGSPFVTAGCNARVYARHRTVVEARDNASIRATDEAIVYAYDNVKVKASGHSYITSEYAINCIISECAIHRIISDDALRYSSTMIKLRKRNSS